MMAKSVIVGVRVPEAVKQKWEELADQDGRTLSNWIKRKIELSQPSSKHPRYGRKAATN